MNFDSFEFLLCFLPITLFLYWFSIKFKKEKIAIISLILCSLFFYAYFELKFLLLIIASVLFNYYFSNFISISKAKSKKKFLFIGILINIFVLIIFKYTNFLIFNFNKIFNEDLLSFNLIFPLALSFYTLQQITYLVDRYQNPNIKISLKKYFLYVTFFPQLIAGPIVLLSQVNDQWNNILKTKNIYENFYKGLFFIAIGLFKKVLISQKFSNIADLGFNNYENISFISAWISSISFSLQFYFDFSAYSDIAVGLALLFNIKLPFNFNSPFKSLSIKEFWTRWHITLSNFINYYMFIPTLKIFNNITLNKITFSTILIMSIIGLWHGPSINYLIFGLLHGLGLAFNTYYSKINFDIFNGVNVKVKKIIFWILTFSFINLTFVYFRSETFFQANQIIYGLLGLNDLFNNDQLITYLSSKSIGKFIILTSIIIFFKNSNEIISNLKINFINSLLLSSLFLIVFYLIMYNSMHANKFIYFKF